MPKKSNKISNRWILETRNDFRVFLDETDFPDPERLGECGPVFTYPEWLIMFIVVCILRGPFPTAVLFPLLPGEKMLLYLSSKEISLVQPYLSSANPS